ncbi:hypothetical protein Hanom_Chr09g00833581 [Helianthus anomalus]
MGVGRYRAFSGKKFLKKRPITHGHSSFGTTSGMSHFSLVEAILVITLTICSKCPSY